MVINVLGRVCCQVGVTYQKAFMVTLSVPFLWVDSKNFVPQYFIH